MNIITLDFETYFDDQYTLSKMTTEAYVRDPRFEAHGVGVRYHEGPGNSIWYSDKQFREIAAPQIDWPNTAVLAHHAHFDGLILSHHYGVKPGYWLDTLSMARMVLGTHERLSLDALTKRFGIKGKTIDYSSQTGFKGLHWDQMPQAIRNNLANGCLDDLEATWALFGKLKDQFPPVEYPIVDLTVRMFTEPKLVGDAEHFAAVRDAEFLSKNELLYELGVGESDLSSNDKFTALLTSMGVEVDMKMSAPTKTFPTGRLVPAVAKSDRFMQELLDSDDETLATLARARVETKSTINETRSGRLHDMATRGPLCVYLNYAGANTRRWSGGDGTNFQNLGRKDTRLRRGVKAPDGYLIASPDQAQGECRLVNWLAGQQDVVDRFARGEDPYLPQASAFFGREITKADVDERQLGKGIELGGGFGMGEEKMFLTLMKDPKIAEAIKAGRITLTRGDTARGIKLYRGSHLMVVALWKEAGDALRKMAAKESFTWRLFEGRDGRIYHPNGTWLDYSTLEWHVDETTGDRFWRLRSRDGWKKMYGAKLVENCLTGDTKVLTVNGWSAISDLRGDEQVWDGVEFVEFLRVAHQGQQVVGNIDGVGMTTDHLVAGKNGWLRAAQAGGHQRPKVRIPDGFTGRGVDWSEKDMVAALRLRQRDHKHYIRVAPERFVRLQEILDPARREDARHGEAPSIRCVPFDAGAVSKRHPSRMEELRRARDHSVQTVERELREFLEGHGANLPEGFVARAQEERRGLLEAQLRLGVDFRTGPEPPDEPYYLNAVGRDNGGGSSETFGAWGDNASLQNCQRVGSREVVYSGQTREQVYDLVNCGPRRQFVVLGNSGPMLVHNCIQWLSRIITAEAMVKFQAMGLPVVGMSHDDVWLLTRADDPRKDEIAAVMATTPSWAPGLPLGADCKLGASYG